jgi:hypothetical protein
MQYYASVLLLNRLPAQIPLYKNYSPLTEAIFNTRRNESNPELSKIDSKIQNYYDMYSMLKSFKTDYESVSEQDAKRDKLGKVFELTYTVMKLLTAELGTSCEVQEIPK